MKQLEKKPKNALSKLIIFACALCLMTSFNSCSKIEDWFKEKEKDEFAIPGLGGSTGKLTGTPYKLPDGIELAGEITGSGEFGYYWFDNYSASSKTERFIARKDGTIKTIDENLTGLEIRAGEEKVYYFGSGLGLVTLVIPLKNVRANPISVTIPAATVFESKTGSYQNGVLIKKVTFTIPANSNYQLGLVLYCGNASRSAANGSAVYVMGVVSDAKALLDLCDRVKNKKINIEEFPATNYESMSIFVNQASELQNIVWNVTDYNGLTSDDIKYINALPNSN